MKYILTFLMLLSYCVFAQVTVTNADLSGLEIPNPGFENWTGNTPDDWFANNIPTGPQPVTPSSNPHSGSLCAKLEVVDGGGGFPFPPSMSAGADGLGFPVSQRYESLDGYYKFAPQTDDFFDISVLMFEGGLQGTFIGSGGLALTMPAADWTQFSVPIDYMASGTPDLCIISIGVGVVQNIGGVALVDDLEFGSATGVDLLEDGIPKQFELSQNYPNPFNPSTNIEYSIPSESFVELKVYDILGNEVASLVNEQQQAGVYRADFSGSNLASGLYIVRIVAGNYTNTIKMSLLK